MGDERFDGTLLQVAQQLTAGAPPGEDAAVALLDLFFGFLRRKTDFFSGGAKADEAVQRACKRQAELVSKADAERWQAEQDAAGRAAAARGERAAKEAAAAAAHAAEARAAAAAPPPRALRSPAGCAQEEARKARLAAAAAAAAALPPLTLTELPPDAPADAAAPPPPPPPPEPDSEAALDAAEAEEAKGKQLPNVGNGGEAGWGTWTQTLGDVELRVAVPYGTTAKACDVQVRKASIKVGLKGAPPLVEGPLFAEVKPDDCFWTVEDKCTVVLSLSKAVGQNWWTHCVAGDPVINTRKVEPENSRLSDLDGDTRTTVEKMMHDQRQKALGRPTSEEEQKQAMLKKFMDAHPEMDFSNAKFS